MTIATADRVTGVQYPLVAIQPFELAELSDGAAVKSVNVPANARVIGGGVAITEAFDSTSSDAIDVGDDGDDDRYSSTAVDGQALAWTALTITGYKYTAPNTIDLTWTSGGGTPTAGAGYLVVMYVVDGRANEVEPDIDV